MNRDTVLEIAIAGVLLVAVIAIQGLPGEEAPAPSESSAPPPPSPVIGPRSSVAPAILEELQPGSHVIADLEPIRLTISLSDTWRRYSRFPVWAAYSRHDGIDHVIAFTTLNPIIDGRWTGCADDELIRPGERSEVTIDGFASVRLRSYAGPGDPRCGQWMLLGALEGPGPPRASATLWVLDVDEAQLVMYAAAEGEDPEPKDELRRLVESVRIDTD